jgi:hypothetical protein
MNNTIQTMTLNRILLVIVVRLFYCQKKVYVVRMETSTKVNLSFHLLPLHNSSVCDISTGSFTRANDFDDLATSHAVVPRIYMEMDVS